jgi:hypothetical protein
LRIDSHFFLRVDTDSGMVLKLKAWEAFFRTSGPDAFPSSSGPGA